MHHVGDKLTFYIYCPDMKKIVSQSNIRSVDPSRGGIINKSIDKLINDSIPISPNDPNVETDSISFRLPISGGILGQEDINCNKKATRKSPRLHEIL